MAKKKKIDFDKYAAGLFTRTEQYADKVRQHYATAVEELLKLTAKGDLGASGAFSFGDNTKLSEKANSVLRGLYSAVYNEIKGGVASEWEYANLSCDALIESIFGKGLNEDNHFARWFSRNQQAMDSFFKRKSAYGGLNLSQNVWKYVGNLKTEMEVALTVSLGQGDSAATVSRKVRQYLQNPDMMFRRFRVKVGEEDIFDEETGEVIGKKPIYGRRWKRKVIDPQTGEVTWENFNPRNYHPGKGVYRSSYKNAMRLTRTETNMAYRSAEQDRWQRMDFVVGYRVKRSTNHPATDICDDLSAANNDNESKRGVYPKDFVFKGWHPQCRCFVVPILASNDEFIEMQKAILNGEEPKQSKDMIRKPNDEFYEWWDKNKERVETATSMPYWVQDNQDYINKKKKIRVKTEEEREEIRKRWAERAIKNQKIIKMATNVANVAQDYPEIDLTNLQDYINAKNASLANSEARAIAKQVAAIKQDEKALSALIPDVHTWKQQFTSAELHQVFDAVEKKLNSIKAYNDLSGQKNKIHYEIDWIKKHCTTKYKTWEVSVAAYEKQEQTIDKLLQIEKLKAELPQIKQYVAKNKGAKKLAGLLNDAEMALAKSDFDEIESKLNALNKNWGALKKSNASRALKKLMASDPEIADLEKYIQEHYTEEFTVVSQSSYEDVMRMLGRVTKEAWRNATEAQRAAFPYYTNSSTHSRRILTNVGLGRDEPYAELLDAILDKIKTERDLVLRSGQDFCVSEYVFGKDFRKLLEAGDIDKLNKDFAGIIGTNKAYMSTSFNEHGGFTKEFEVHIFAPKGTHCMNLNELSGFGQGRGTLWDGEEFYPTWYDKGETEIFLHRGYRWRFLRAEKGVGLGGRDRIYIQLLNRETTK